MLDGDLYLADDPELAQASQRAARLAAAYTDSCLADPAGARAILEELLGQVGEGVDVRAPLYVDYGNQLSIGAGSVVTKDIPANSVAVGTPAKVVRSL